MNKTLKITFALFLSLIFFSCSKDDNILTKDSQTFETNEQLITILNDTYGITTEILENNNFEFTYPDGLTLKMEKQDDQYIASGDKINNTEIQIFVEEGDESIEKRLLFKNIENDETIEKKDFIKIINSSTSSSDGYVTRDAPCSEHPSGESFDECFKSDWDDFCDGAVGCIAKFTHPGLIAGVIAAHCAAC